MRLGRGREPSSWRIAIGDRQMTTVALWLRDASGMEPDLDPAIPPLTPVVPLRENLAALVNPQAVAQWTGLWVGMWEGRISESKAHRGLGPDRFELLAQSPQLKALWSAGFRDAAGWSNAYRPLHSERGKPPYVPHEPGEVVRRLETELGRRARDFSLEIVVLPVSGRLFWLLPDDRLVASEALVRDGRAFRALLYDVLSLLV